ncbi:hypothetical protein Y032_0037g3428 [Ancylostoma ceylanicum]|uniref:DUF1758 domain-containing protein n=1 Tax=Ancylostoma ceylanicum TaxID=53326 RepID=A0A016UK30_9BILA|nr:hypothetical protein Y032_0037g3428 [Ancylostoma ceylanicum]
MMATIRGCKNQLTRAINNLQRGLNQYDQVPLDSNGIENEPPNTRLRRIAERKIDLIAAKSRLEDLLLELQTKFQAAVDFAQRAPINPDSIPPVEEIDNHWVEHNGEEIEENARKALSVIKATYRQLEVLEASASLEIQYYIGSPHSVPPTTQIRREAAAAPDTPPPGFENTPRRILSSTNVVLNHPQEFSQPQPMHNGSVSSQQIDATMILPSQLQKLEIEPYYGDIARFSEFWCCFDTLVHSNVNIPIAAKFQHLKRALKGDAALVLRGFLTTPENYPRVIKLLHKRYNRPHYARSLIYRQLKDLPHASASANSQRNTLCQIQSLLSQLSTMESSSDAISMLELVRSKFPEKTRHELAKRQHASGTTWNLEQLIEGLEAVVEELEAIDDYQSPLQTTEYHTHSTSLSPRRSRSSSPRFDPEICCFCRSSNHPSYRCRRDMPVRQRRRIVRMFDLCWICFQQGHSSRHCRMQGCQRCGRDHNVLVCDYRNSRRHSPSPFRRSTYAEDDRRQSRTQYRTPRSRYPSRESSYDGQRSRNSSFDSRSSSYDRYRSRTQSNRRLSFDSSNRLSPNPRRVSFADPVRDESSSKHRYRPGSNRDTSQNHSAVINSSSTESEDEYATALACLNASVTSESAPKETSASHKSVLMLISARIFNRYTNLLEDIDILLDSGSQTSFISNSAVKRLGLPTHSPKHLTIVTLGGHSTSEMSTSADVQLVDLNGKTLNFTMNTKERLTAPHNTAPVTKEDALAILSLGIEVNPVRSTVVIPEILLGIDYFWDVVSREPSKVLPSGMVLTHTRFGPIISGTEFFHTAHALTDPPDLDDDHQDVSKLWELDAIGITDNPDPSRDEEESERAVKQFFNTVQEVDGMLFVQFPWKIKHPRLADNKQLAFKRLQSQYKSLQNKPELWASYAKTFEDQIAAGIIEEVEEDVFDPTCDLR